MPYLQPAAPSSSCSCRSLASPSPGSGAELPTAALPCLCYLASPSPGSGAPGGGAPSCRARSGPGLPAAAVALSLAGPGLPAAALLGEETLHLHEITGSIHTLFIRDGRNFSPGRRLRGRQQAAGRVPGARVPTAQHAPRRAEAAAVGAEGEGTRPCRPRAEVSRLLMAVGARIPGVVNPSQLGRRLRIKE